MAPEWLRAALTEHGTTLAPADWRAMGYSEHQARELAHAARVGIESYKPRRQRLRSAKPAHRSTAQALDIEHAPVPDGEIPIDELLELKRRAARRRMARHEGHQRRLTLPAEPLGLFVMGDPHVDNEGCDWDVIMHHVEVVQRTDGILAACVGDMQDNWIGRLARLYAHSSTSAADGYRLSEWLLSAMQWVAIVGGNHDAWAHGPGVDPMAWLTQKCQVPCYAPDELRITLDWKGRPDLEPVIWLLRHDFKGRSWYHPTHGPNKEAMLDGRVHLLTAGHIHQWGALTTEQRHERVTHAVRIRGYKRADEHAKALGFPEQQHGESVLVVIDPEVDGPGRIVLFWDIEQGADYLRWLRKR